MSDRSRPRLSVFIAQSLDGFIARPDLSLDFLARVERPGEDYGYRAFFDSIDTLVIGRKTHDVARGFDPWPYAGKRCVVLTHATPPQLAPFTHGETSFAGTPAALVEHLASLGVAHAYLDGGTVIRQFLDARLVDSLTLSILPVLIGTGIRLFGATPDTKSPLGDLGLELLGARTFPSGLVQLHYRPDARTP